MNRISVVAALSLLVSVGACGNAAQDLIPSGTAIDAGAGTDNGLLGGEPVAGATIDAVADDARDVPASPNRMHIGKPLGRDLGRAAPLRP